MSAKSCTAVEASRGLVVEPYRFSLHQHIPGLPVTVPETDVLGPQTSDSTGIGHTLDAETLAFLQSLTSYNPSGNEQLTSCCTYDMEYHTSFDWLYDACAYKEVPVNSASDGTRDFDSIFCQLHLAPILHNGQLLDATV